METQFFYKRKRKGIVKNIALLFIAFVRNKRWGRYARAILRFFRNLPIRIYIGVFATCLFVGGVGYVLFFSGYFAIQTIVIESNAEYIDGDIKKYFEKENKKMLLGFVPRTTIVSSFGHIKEEILKEHPVVQTINISFELPNTMYVEVILRKHEGIWCSTRGNNVCFFYAKDGVIFEDAPNATQGFLLRFVRDARENEFELGNTVLTEQEMYEIDLLYKALGAISEQPAYISIEDVQEIRAGFFGGWEAYFSRTDPLVAQVENVYAILEDTIKQRRNELAYIDARFGNKLFYRYKTTPVTQEISPNTNNASSETEDIAN